MADTKFIREKKDRNYTMLDNTFIRDTRLSWKAKGLMTYLLSLPDDWEIHLSEIEQHATDGMGSLRSAVNELKKFGYLKSETRKDEKNRFIGVVYIIIECPYSDFPHTDFPHTENCNLPITNNTNDLITNDLLLPMTEKREGQRPAPAKKRKTPPFQKPTVSEIAEYTQSQGFHINPDKFYDYYESNGWRVGKGTMKDWRATVRNWERMDKERQEQRQAPQLRRTEGHTSADYTGPEWEHLANAEF